MPGPFWLVCVVCCFGFAAVSSLSNVAPAYVTFYNNTNHLRQDSQEVINLSEWPLINNVCVCVSEEESETTCV